MLSLVATFGASAVVATPAHASPASWVASHYHGGTQTLIVRVQGTFTWHNRSVSPNDNQVYLRAGYCGGYEIKGYGSDGRLYGEHLYSGCSNVNGWYEFPAFTLVGWTKRG